LTFGSAATFARGASVAAALGALALLPWLAGDDRLAAAWSARGFAAMAIPGVVGGTWLARKHGRRASRFVVALGAGFLARLVLAGIAAFGAAKAGGGAIEGLLAGLAAGFVPVMAFEMFWFARATRAQGAGLETRG
jgi:hypothetical protein